MSTAVKQLVYVFNGIAEFLAPGSGEHVLSSGSAADVARAVKTAQADSTRTILIFDDGTGQQTDFDLRGTDKDIVERLTDPGRPALDPKRPGRPKLGVIAREVTLLPRHWGWLSNQPGGASVTLRKLIDAARPSQGNLNAVRQAQQAADRVMMALLGNQPGYEEAARALYAGNRERFLEFTEPWPRQFRDYARRLAAPAFPASAA